MVNCSSIFAQYRSFNKIYVFTSTSDENQVNLEVYNLALNLLKTRQITVSTLADLHLPDDLGKNVTECVLRLLQEGYYPSFEGWKFYGLKPEQDALDEKKVLAVLQTATELEQNNPDYSCLLARMHKQVCKKEEALFYYRKAAEQYLAKNKRYEAIKCYKVALKIAPDCYEIYDSLTALYNDNKQKANIYLKGALYFITKRAFREAESLCKKAKDCCGNDFLIHHPYLELLQQEKRSDEFVEMSLEFAKNFEVIKDDNAAIACYEKVINFSPNAFVYRKIIDILLRSSQKDRLLSKYLEWISFCISQKHWEEAEAVTNEALEKVGDEPQLLRKLKKIYTHLGSHQLQPLFIRLGEAYEKHKEPDKARKVYKVAWERFQDVKACFALTSILTQQGLLEHAAILYKQLAAKCFLMEDMPGLYRCVSEIRHVDPLLTQFDPQEKMAFFTYSYISRCFLGLQKTQDQLQKTQEELNYTSNLLATILSDIRCVTTLEGHAQAVWTLKPLQNGQLASGSFDHSVKIWQLGFGCIGNLKGHTKDIQAIELLPNGLFLSGSEDCKIKVWDLKTFTCTKTLEGHNRDVQGFAVLPDDQFASVSNDKTIKIWDANTFTCIKTLTGHDEAIWSIKLLSDNLLATGSYDNTIRIWDFKKGECTGILKGHTAAIVSLELLSDGQLASGSKDKTIRIWDLKKMICKQILEGHQGTVFALKFLPNGQLVSGSGDKKIKFWDLKKFVSIKSLEGHTDSVFSLELSLDGKLVSGSEDKTIKIWNLPSYA